MPNATRASFCAAKFTSFVDFEQENIPVEFGPRAAMFRRNPSAAASRATSHDVGVSLPFTRTIGSVIRTYSRGAFLARRAVFPARTNGVLSIEGIRNHRENVQRDGIVQVGRGLGAGAILRARRYRGTTIKPWTGFYGYGTSTTTTWSNGTCVRTIGRNRAEEPEIRADVEQEPDFHTVVPHLHRILASDSMAARVDARHRHAVGVTIILLPLLYREHPAQSNRW